MMRSFWTPERDEELQRHAAAGLSASKIAVLLHTTRGAILGRSNRLRGKIFKSDPWLKKQRIAAKKRNSANQLAGRRSAGCTTPATSEADRRSRFGPDSAASAWPGRYPRNTPRLRSPHTT